MQKRLEMTGPGAHLIVEVNTDDDKNALKLIDRIYGFNAVLTKEDVAKLVEFIGINYLSREENMLIAEHRLRASVSSEAWGTDDVSMLGLR